MPAPFVMMLDLYELNILDISDVVTPNVAEYEFINTDGAKLDNLGNKARKTRFKTYFFGDDPVSVTQTGIKTATYQNHFKFLEDMTTSSKYPHVLRHPQYGDITGHITNITIYHNDTHDYVEIDIEFTQDGLLNQGIITDTTVDDKLSAQAINALNAQIAGIKSQLTQNSQLAALAGKVIDFSKNMADQIGVVTSAARAWTQEADQFCNNVDGFFNSITQPILTLNNTITFTKDIPGRIMSSVQKAMDRIISVNTTAAVTPKQLVQNVTDSMNSLIKTVTNPKNFYHAQDGFYTGIIIQSAASNTTQALGKAYSDDENNRASQQANEKNKTWDEAGNLVNKQVQLELLSLTEIEESLFYARDLINQAIATQKDLYDLKTMAATLVKYVDEIKLKKREIQSINTTEMPMHVLCTTMGQSYAAADRFLKLNPNIKNPTFTEGTIDVYIVNNV